MTEQREGPMEMMEVSYKAPSSNSKALHSSDQKDLGRTGKAEILKALNPHRLYLKHCES